VSESIESVDSFEEEQPASDTMSTRRLVKAKYFMEAFVDY
jgi:hypothetical protein